MNFFENRSIKSYREYKRIKEYLHGQDDYELYDAFCDEVMGAYDKGRITADAMNHLLTFYTPREEQINFILKNADFRDINYQGIA